ncbi:protein SPEAR1 [Prunus yedoensis var. nudiflora]|uniref:Protein SPEAR1 n=1 Tax=Prunus yedoensis var. nudiflora TaxID=2094558 RepID=A0A314YY18_PRUYE|nr:protein SPEAR1 [Prunus yedoensis var. nudiflora]
MMGVGEYERANIIYMVEIIPHRVQQQGAWDVHSNAILDTQHFVQPSMTRHLLNPPPVEDSQHNKSKKHRSSSMGSSSQNSESSDTQELDLELRLSL